MALVAQMFHYLFSFFLLISMLFLDPLLEGLSWEFLVFWDPPQWMRFHIRDLDKNCKKIP
jgi:hypothetical protein